MSRFNEVLDKGPVASHYMSRSNEVLHEEPIASRYMSYSDVTSDKETETSRYMSHLNEKLESTPLAPSRACSEPQTNEEDKEL